MWIRGFVLNWLELKFLVHLFLNHVCSVDIIIIMLYIVRRIREESDCFVEGLLTTEISMVALDTIELTIQVCSGFSITIQLYTRMHVHI